MKNYLISHTTTHTSPATLGMDGYRSRPEADAPGSAKDTATATQNAETPGRLVTQGFGPPSSRPALAAVAKDAIPATPLEYSTPDDVMIRGSWVSFTSTAAGRDSVAPSIFSRYSMASAATRYSARQSSIESPISIASPIYAEHRKSSFPVNPRYRCTFCDEAFETMVEWKLHEYDTHDHPEFYPCGDCQAVFPRTALLAEHLRSNHGHDHAASAPLSVQYGPIRNFWSCGFCGDVTPARSEYLAHVGRHYDEGKDSSQWQHTRVIEGLLHQPGLESAWIALVDREEQLRGAKLRFLWDPSTSGRSTEPGEPHRLQDILEFFATGTKTAAEVAAAAYNNARVRVEGDVRGLTSKLFSRDSNPKPARPASNPFQLSPDLPPAPEAIDDVVSPISPLPTPLRSLAAPLRSSNPPLAPSDENSSTSVHTRPENLTPSENAPAKSSGGTAPMPRVSESQDPITPEPPLPTKLSGLRRIDSSRSLTPSSQVGSDKALARSAIGLLPPVAAFDAPSTPTVNRAGTPAPSSSARSDLSFMIRYRKSLSALNVNMGSPARPYTSSSTGSTHLGDESLGFGDSASDVVSDDSVSEPESWLEVDGIPKVSKAWKASFQRCIDQGMGRLWARYNRDWDVLVRQCVGDAGGGSSQPWASSGPVRKPGSSLHAYSKGFRLGSNSFGQEDDEEDDDDRPPSSTSKLSAEFANSFACPYRKRDPRTYNRHDHEVCANHTWPSISRLK